MFEKALQALKSFICPSRLKYYFLFFAIFLLPTATSLSILKKVSSDSFLIMSLLGAFSLISLCLLLIFWERKMKRTAARLVKAKLAHLNLTSGSEVSLLKRAHEEEISSLELKLHQMSQDVFGANLVISQKQEEMRHAYLEFEDLRKEYDKLKEECIKLEEGTKEQLSHKDLLIQDYQRTISEQRKIIEKKQRLCDQLENKVEDLMVEIRGLLQLENSGGSKTVSSFVVPAHELSSVLQKYIEKAEKLTGVEHLGQLNGKSSRFFEFSGGSFAVDTRRLTDTFLEEDPEEIVFIYSQVERKFLFVNRYVKTLLGYSSEKFMKEFPHLVSSGYSEWKAALSKVSSIKEVGSNLNVQNKLGKNVSLECLMSSLSKGPFAHNVLGVLKPNE